MVIGQGVSFGDTKSKKQLAGLIDGSATHIDIPEGTTKIFPYAFYDRGLLTSVTIPNSVTQIGQYAFCGCYFTSVIIPKGVTNIGQYAFEGCGELTNVKISNTVTTISNYAFYMCGELVDIDLTEFDISDYTFQIPYIASYTFEGVSENVKFYFKDESTLRAFTGNMRWSVYSSQFEVRQVNS